MDTYLNIPYSLLVCNKFDAVDKILLAEILALSKLPKGCFKSDTRFGQLVNLKRSAVNKRMKNLEKAMEARQLKKEQNLLLIFGIKLMDLLH